MKTLLSPPKQHLSSASSAPNKSIQQTQTTTQARNRATIQPTYSSKNNNQPPSPQSTHQPTTPTPSNQNQNQSFSIGDRVQCSNSMVGICRFIGTIHSKPGIWVGIDLANQKHQPPNPWHGKGKNSGSVNGVVYFECLPLCGIFFPLSKVSLLPREPSSPSSLRVPHAQANQDSSELSSAAASMASFSSTSSSSPRHHSQSDLLSSKHGSLSSNPSTPRPKNRPSLPAPRENSTPTRNPSLPLIPSSSPTVIPAKKQQLIRKPSTVKLTNSSRTISTLFDLPPPQPTPHSNSNPTDQQLANTPDMSSNNKVSKNPLSKSTNQTKRSSAYQLPSRPSSRTCHKRAESVNSHYDRTDLPHWTRPSHGQRPKSRLSLISTSRPRHQSQPPNTHLNGLPQMPILQTENAQLQTKNSLLEIKILTLEKEVGQTQLRSAELDQKHLDKCKELKLELDKSKESLNQLEKDRLIELEKVKQELTQQSQPELNSLREEIANLNESLKNNKQTLSEQTSKFDRERTELHNQLHQLRSAGQSLCGVYENKISHLEEARLSQLHESELISEELKATKLALEELQEKTRLNPTDSSANAAASVDAAKEAIEIDNERLKADLKHTKERLSEVQDEAYQLKQELETERETHEQQSQLHEETLQQHMLSIKDVKDENSKLENQRASLEFKLGQVEARLKETLETMEQERVELEGLRAELLVSSHPPPQPLSSSHSTEDENNETATIVNTATAGSVLSEPMMSDLSSNSRQAQLESELKEKQSRIEFLENELGRHLSLGKSKSSIQSENHQMDSNAIMDQEKMLVIQKYQRLLLIKDEENLKLMNRLEELEEEVENNSKSRFSLAPSRGLLFQQFQSSPKLKHHASTQSLRTTKSFHSSPRVTSMCSPNPNRNLDEIDTAKELAKVTQQLVGLKLIARQSNDERAKCEKANQALKETIEDLKQNNRTLEQKVVQLVEAGSSGVMKNGKSDQVQRNRSSSFQELGIETESALADIRNTLNESNENRPTPHGGSGEVIIGDYKRVKMLELEIDQLKDKLVNFEQKHSRQVGALQNEVIELEGIIEVKLFQEEKLESEIQDLKQIIDATKQAQMNASTPRVGGGGGGGLPQSNSKHLRRQTISPDYQTQKTTFATPPPPIPSTQWTSSSRRASSFEYDQTGSSTGFDAHVGEKSLDCLREEENEQQQPEGDKGHHVLKERQSRFSKAFGVLNGPYRHHRDGSSQRPDSKTQIIVTDNDGSSPSGSGNKKRLSKRDRSESNHRHTIANSPASSSKSPHFPPPLPNPLPNFSIHPHPSPSPLPSLDNDVLCELCDAVDHSLADCPIFSDPKN